MRLFFYCIVGLLLGLAACSRDEPAARTTAELGHCGQTADCEPPMVCVNKRCESPAIVNPESPASGNPTVIPPPAAVNRPILVGGCLGHCNRPKDAVNHFFTAVFQPDRNVEKIRSFFETSQLQHNQSLHGKDWVQMYLNGNLTKRSDSINQWLNQWLQWVERIADPMDRSLDSAAIRVVFQDQSRYVIEYRPPDIKEDVMQKKLGRVWRIEWRTRGLEWLVSRINDEAIAVRSVR